MNSKRPRPTVPIADNEMVILGEDGLPWNDRVQDWILLNEAYAIVNKVTARLPRPKKNPTHRSEVIAAMKPWRTEGDSFKEFLAAASTGDVSVTITAISGGYLIECPRILDTDGGMRTITVTEKTLREWWTAVWKKTPVKLR